MNETLDKFRSIRNKQLLSITDVDLIIELDDFKKGTSFLVKEKREYHDHDTQYVVLTLDHIGTDLEYLLVCSAFKEYADVMLFKQPDFFRPDQRCIIENTENDWLFDFENYPQEIYNGEIVFSKKKKREVFGDSCLVEWETDAEIVDYKLLLIETGIQHDGGGWVEFYAGRQINDRDVVI